MTTPQSVTVLNPTAELFSPQMNNMEDPGPTFCYRAPTDIRIHETYQQLSGYAEI